MSESEGRPKWPYKIPEAAARWFNTNTVIKITHHWEMTSADTSREWLVLHSDKAQMQVSTRFLAEWPEIIFWPDHKGLIGFAYGSDIWFALSKIDQWLAKEAKDLAEYKRLKAKFGDAAS